MRYEELIDKIWNGERLTEAQLTLLEQAGYTQEVAEYRSREHARTQSYADLAREWGFDGEHGEPVEQD